MRPKKSLTEQAAVLFAGNVLVLLFGVVVPIVLVRVFPLEEYGLYQQLSLIFATLLPIGQMGVTQGLYYFLPREPKKKDAIVTQTFIFVVVAGATCLLFLVLFRGWIGEIMNNPLIAKYLPIMAAFIFLMIVSSFIDTLMIAEGRVHLASLIRVIFGLFRSIIVVVTALISRSIPVVLFALLVFSLSRCLFQWLYLRRRYRLSLRRIDFHFWWWQLGYSVPIGLENVTWLLQRKLHSFFVSFFFPPATFAVYAVGTYNLPFLGIITSSISNVMTPELSRSQKDGDKDRIFGVWKNAMRKMNLFFFPIFVFFCLMAHEFIVTFFTINYIDSVPIFRISLLGLLVSGINTGAILNAYAETRYQLRIALLRLPIAIVALYLFTKMWGVLGTVTADVLVSIGFVIFVLGKVARVMEVPFGQLVSFRKNGRIMAAALLAGAPILVVRNYLPFPPLFLLTVSFPVYTVCYFALCFALKTMSWREITSFRNIPASLRMWG